MAEDDCDSIAGQVVLNAAIVGLIMCAPCRDVTAQTPASGDVIVRIYIAHEIGHLLLGTVVHPKTGLMRGHWTTHGRIGAWAFSSAEGAGMRDGLASRDETAVLGIRPAIVGRLTPKKRESPKAPP